MASPFEFFRKNQKVMMVWLTILAMFSFIVLGTIADLGNNESMMTSFPMAMGLLIGGCAIGLAFRKTQWQWPGAILGAVLGAWIGSYIGIDALEGQAVVKIKGDDLTQMQVQQLINKRQIANQFVQEAFVRSNPQMMQMANNPMFQNFIMNMIRQASFGFGMETMERDVVLGEVLRLEAQNAGMVISDEFVTDYIQQITRQSLSTEDFGEILRDMQMSDLDLYNILREELMARQALFVFRPQASPTPEQLWSMYAKTAMRESLDVIPVSVSSFVDQVKAPSDAELKKFFEEHKSVYPNQEGEGTVGFKQPDRAVVTYLEADYSTFEKLVGEVTDEEITAYYEANKELYKNEVFPNEIDEMSFPELDMTKPLGSTSVLSQPMGSNSTLSKPLDSTSVISEPMGSASVLSTPTGSTSVPAVPIMTPAATPAEPAPTETKPEGEPQSRVKKTSSIQLVSFQEEKPAQTDEPKPATEEKPSETPAVEAPKANAPVMEAPKSDEAPQTEQTKPATEQPDAPAMPEDPSTPVAEELSPRCNLLSQQLAVRSSTWPIP